MLTLSEFLELKDDCDITVYDHNAPVLSWVDNDPKYAAPVIRFGIVSEGEMWVDIDLDCIGERGTV